MNIKNYFRIFLKSKGNIKQFIINIKSYNAIQNSIYFDRNFYLDSYPGVKKSGIDPLIHYLFYGFKENKIPSKDFDGNFYLDSYPGVKKSGMNPLTHYLLYGIKEGKKLKNEIINEKYISDIFYSANNESADFVEDIDFSVDLNEDDIKLIAFYLPQYHHPIPENNQWWEKGFTEWTNVTKAIPRFLDQYQPQLPIDLGFYDLRMIETHKNQVKLAKKYGIYGFCYHYYWFGGKRLLEKPLEMVLEHPELDFPFCISWANENWSRRWDGGDNDILISQKYSHKDDLEIIKDLSQYFKDERYIKIDGKFLLLIYRPNLLPNPEKTFEIWRNYCKEENIGELFIVKVLGYHDDYNLLGSDALVQFPPNRPRPSKLKENIEFVKDKGEMLIFDMEEFIESEDYINDKDNKKTIFRCLVPSWDNTARKKERGHVFQVKPKYYKKWLNNLINFTKNNMDEKHQFIFINAWNEWAEGAHLEPDRKWGYSYLKATAETIIESRKVENILNSNIANKMNNSPKVSVIIPVYNAEKYLDKCLENIINQTLDDIEIICVDDGSTDNSPKILEEYSKKDRRIKVVTQENKDVGAARGKGVELSKGEYISFVDNDDLLAVDALEKLYNNAKSNNSDMVIFKVAFYYTDTDSYVYPPAFDFTKYFDDNTDYNNFVFKGKDVKNQVMNSYFAPWFKFFNSKFLKSYNFYFKENITYPDVPFHVQAMLKANRISFLPENLYFYRREHQESMLSISSDTKRIFDIFLVVDEVENFLIKNNLMEEYRDEFLEFKIQQIKFWFFRCGKSYFDEYFKKSKEELINLNLSKNKANSLPERFSKFYFSVINSQSYNEVMDLY